MSPTRLSAVFTLTEETTRQVGADRIRLLRAVRDQGSISGAGRALGLSYKAAWDGVNALNNLFPRPLVAAHPGGQRGGGATLTPEGEALLAAYGRLQQALDGLMADLSAALSSPAADPAASSADPAAVPPPPPPSSPLPPLRRLFAMKTTARNALSGTITRIVEGSVNAEVALDLGDGTEVIAMVTDHSVKSLGLAIGTPATALIKSSFVVLTTEEGPLRTSARNCLCGLITHRHDGPVSAEITLTIGVGKTLTALITHDSAQSLGLVKGARACALIKASHILLAVD